MALLQSQLNNYGHTLFDGNIAQNGGAMGLRDFSVVSFTLVGCFKTTPNYFMLAFTSIAIATVKLLSGHPGGGLSIYRFLCTFTVLLKLHKL